MAACKRQSSSRGETCETSGAGEKRKKIVSTERMCYVCANFKTQCSDHVQWSTCRVQEVEVTRELGANVGVVGGSVVTG